MAFKRKQSETKFIKTIRSIDQNVSGRGFNSKWSLPMCVVNFTDGTYAIDYQKNYKHWKEQMDYKPHSFTARIYHDNRDLVFLHGPHTQLKRYFN